jgi:hypothetical protein
MNSLKKGNLQSVTFSEINGDSKKYIEAVPQYKNINLYNEEGKKQFIPHERAEGKTESVPASVTEPALEEKKSAGIRR